MITEQEQFDIINQPEYFNKLKAKINRIKTAMNDLEAGAAEVRTKVDNVPIIISFISETEGRIRVGIATPVENSDREYLYDWIFPIRWLEEATPA